MILRLRSLLKIPKRNVSALYITGDKATENYAILVPHMDFADKLTNREALELNLSRRRLTANYNLNELYQYYELYTTIKEKLRTLETRDSELSDEMKILFKDKQQNEDMWRKLKNESATVRSDLKELKWNTFLVDDKFVHGFLALPNDIHQKTPDELQVISTIGIVKLSDSQKKVSVDGIVDYFDETAFYLEQNAAKFDLFFPLYCIDQLKEQGYVHFSNPDFAKSILIEAAGLPLNEVYEVKHEPHENDIHLMHLIGNASMISYLGYISKLIVEPAFFPLQFVCSGKQYLPQEENNLGLLGVSQSTAVQVFCAGKKEQMEQQFDDILGIIETFYAPFGLHYRVVNVPAHNLLLAESRKVLVEMFSTQHNRYITVGNVCCYSDFISKRLLFSYKENKETQFPHIVSGTICNVTKLIALLLEENGQHFKIPSYLEEYANA